jgi:hypothetical protein
VRFRTRAWDLLQAVAGLVSDRLYLSVRFRRRLGRWSLFRKPRDHNEFVQLYKLSSRGDLRMPPLSDKIAVKERVAAAVGADHVIPLIWHGTELPPREARNWPMPYVIKASHGWAANIFVRKPEDEDWPRIEAECAEWLAHRHGRHTREWHYLRIKPQLLVEQFIECDGTSPSDYKFFVFDGRVEILQKDEDRHSDHRRYLFDRDWQLLPYSIRIPAGPSPPPPPASLPRMLEIAETLGAGFEFVSVDLYDADGHVYFGELTFFPAAGFVPFYPPEASLIVGEMWARSRARADDRSRNPSSADRRSPPPLPTAV